MSGRSPPYEEQLQNHLRSAGRRGTSERCLRLSGLRISPNVYTTLEEIDTFVEAMEDALKGGVSETLDPIPAYPAMLPFNVVTYNSIPLIMRDGPDGDLRALSYVSPNRRRRVMKRQAMATGMALALLLVGGLVSALAKRPSNSVPVPAGGKKLPAGAYTFSKTAEARSSSARTRPARRRPWPSSSGSPNRRRLLPGRDSSSTRSGIRAVVHRVHQSTSSPRSVRRRGRLPDTRDKGAHRTKIVMAAAARSRTSGLL